jgi:hypothetical protein
MLFTLKFYKSFFFLQLNSINLEIILMLKFDQNLIYFH